MAYRKTFAPEIVKSFRCDYAAALDDSGDLRDGSVYVYTEDLILAVNVCTAPRL